MRKYILTAITSLTLGVAATAPALAEPPSTGVPALDAFLATAFDAVTGACASPAQSVAACEAAMRYFASLADVDVLLAAAAEAGVVLEATEVAVVQAAFAADPATGVSPFAQSFAVASADLADTITAFNADNPEFLTAVAPALEETVGFGSGAGPEEASP